jgi:predicted O-methyltransferase YrrM
MPTIEEAVAAADKIQGWMLEVELRWLATTAQGKDLAVEIGSWRGRSSKAIASMIGGTLFCIDPWDQGLADYLKSKGSPVAIPEGVDGVFSEFKANLATEIASGKVRPVRSKSHKAMGDVLPVIGNRKLDMVFIDGSHTYDAVHADVKIWMPMVAKGGIICGHDYDHRDYPGVKKVVTELVQNVHILPGTGLWWSQIV